MHIRKSGRISLKVFFFCASLKSTFVSKILAIFLINNRDPVLPIDVKFSLVDRKVNETEVFDEETFEAILVSDTRIRGEIHESVTSNIRKAQDKQKKDFDRRHLSNSEIKVEDLIFLRSNKRKDRKGGKF